MMSLTKAKAIAKNPAAYSVEELDDALTTIVDSPDLTEAQVTRLQAKIDPMLRSKLNHPAGKGRPPADDPFAGASDAIKAVIRHGF